MLVVIMAAVLIFLLENRSSVLLSFMGWGLPPLPVSIYVLMAFCLGLFFGVLAGVFQFWIRRKKPRHELPRDSL
jgi:uncharacterized integral membrane protein